jgi:Ran GTPase-activating protein (RanGAP) involved in mRNA processing and transport
MGDSADTLPAKISMVAVQALAGLGRLQEMDLSNNDVGDVATPLVVALASLAPSLSALQLSGCGMEDADVLVLSPSSELMQRLRCLDLSQNFLSLNGVQAIRQAVGHLHLDYLGIAEQDCKWTYMDDY